MIKKLIASSIFLCLLFAIFLSLNGVEHAELSRPFLAFLYNSSRELEDFKIEIPDIPTIPDMESVDGILLVIDLLRKFVNGLVTILNFVVLVINTIIQVLEFIFILLKNFITMKDTIVGA